MKNTKKLPIFFVLALILITSYCTSCKQTNEEIESASNDSTNTKYKDNTQLQILNKQILDNASADSLYRKRANIYIQIKDFELALADAIRALKLDSSSSQNYLLLTDIYYVTNKTRNAKETLERCIKFLPKDKSALIKMAELFFYVKNYQESINMINRALTEDPFFSKAYFLKCMNYMKIGVTGKAFNSMLTAVEQDNNYYTAYIQLALLHYFKKSVKCIEYYNQALRISPNSTEALYGKGKYFQEIGKTKEAKVFYSQILSIDPTYKTASYNLGAITLATDKNAVEAKKYFNQAINIDQKYTEAYFARGVCFEELKDKKNAIADYKTALQLTPNYEAAINALNKLLDK